jgi:2-methylcitrate dehydratase PrpD
MSTTDDLTGLVVRTALQSSLNDIPESSLNVVKLAILDFLACCVAGSNTDAAQIVMRWATSTSGRDDAVIVGTSQRTSPPLAALANGTAAHALDFDDVSMRMIHPSATLVPVLLAIGEARNLSGQQLMAGYVAGFEVQARLCREINPDHYERGWHSTGTVGALGAAMAACRAYDVDEKTARWALGIAASSASSIRKNFGSMVKPLHAGQAAFHGLGATDLAIGGFSADDSILEGKNGFLDLFSSLDRAESLYVAFADDAPYEIVESGIALKRFACCGAIHSAQDAILELVATTPFTVDDVESIECRVNRMVPNILMHHVTQDGLEGKFSMEYSLAVCLLDGRAGLAQYRNDRASDPHLLALMQRVHVVVDESIPVNLAFFPSIVTVRLRGGQEHTTRVDVPVGYPTRPLPQSEVIAKARECCDGILDTDQVDSMIDAVINLEAVSDVSVLARTLATVSTTPHL